MRIFSRFYVFVFFGIVLLLVGSVTDVQAQGNLQVSRDFGPNRVYDVGDTLEVIFTATDADGKPVDGVKLTIRHSGLGDVTVSGGGITDLYGEVAVRGTLLVAKGAYISAAWVEMSVELTGYFNGVHVGISPAIIVVSPPDPKSPLTVGDTFTQVIDIQDATDLASWQMDIAFNPDVLDVVAISKGDFLEQDGRDALFLDEWSPGRISVKQVRLGPVSGVSGSGVLVKFTFRFLSFSEALLGLHNVRLSDPSGDRLSYSVNLTPVVATHASSAVEDVNQDGQVDILDLVAAAGSIGSPRPNTRADVNGDGIVDILDLVAITGSPHWGRSVGIIKVREPNATAPTASALTLTPETVREWITLARIKNDGSLLFRRGILNLESLLAARVPSETRLLLNYPNPFNPETWIPYQLSASADVSVSIYAIDGCLVRRLELGHRSAGIYRSRSRAAYWDGRNEFGERVASGLYFYTLTAGDFTATRKMLIRK